MLGQSLTDPLNVHNNRGQLSRRCSYDRPALQPAYLSIGLCSGPLMTSYFRRIITHSSVMHHGVYMLLMWSWPSTPPRRYSVLTTYLVMVHVLPRAHGGRLVCVVFITQCWLLTSYVGAWFIPLAAFINYTFTPLMGIEFFVIFLSFQTSK